MVVDMGVSLLIALVGAIGTFAVMRYMIGECKKNQSVFLLRLEKHGDDIVALNTKSELAVTAKDVDEKFVSKELFRQFEKHIDKRFDAIEKGQIEILSYMKGCTNDRREH